MGWWRWENVVGTLTRFSALFALFRAFERSSFSFRGRFAFAELTLITRRDEKRMIEINPADFGMALKRSRQIDSSRGRNDR